MVWIVVTALVGLALWAFRAWARKPAMRAPSRRRRALQPPSIDRVAAGQAEVVKLAAAMEAAGIDPGISDAVWDECVRAITWSGSYWGMHKRLKILDESPHSDDMMQRLDVVHGRPSTFIRSWAETLRLWGITWTQLETLAVAMPWASSDYLEFIDKLDDERTKWWIRRMARTAPDRSDAVLAGQAFTRAKWSPSDMTPSQKYFARAIRDPRMTQADLAALVGEISDPSDESLFAATLWRKDAARQRDLLATWDDEVDHCFVADGGGLVEVTRIGLLAGEAISLGVDGCPSELSAGAAKLETKPNEPNLP